MSGNIPALRQSHCETMACEVCYAAKVIEGKDLPPSMASDRGQDIHQVMAEYNRICTDDRVPGNWGLFDKLAALRGTEARKILRGLRGNYVVDFEHSIGTEKTLSLDKYFQPCPVHVIGAAAYTGTLDHLLDFGYRGKIEDFKSHPAPFDPDTPQGHLYPLLALQHHPEWDEVVFELIFVRYKNARRSVTLTRSAIPDLMEYMENYRERQIQIHARYARQPFTGVTDLQALPGPHCGYCPKLVDITCPIAEFNPHMTKTPEERLRFNVWAAQLKSQNDVVLKSYVTASGNNVAIQDGNDEVYEFGCWDAVSTPFPLPGVVKELLQWKEERGEDFAHQLYVKSTELKSKLKAKKRQELAERIATHVVPENTPRWGVKRPDGKVEEEEQ